MVDFSRYAPEKIQYAIDRYQNETRRLYRVLDTRLGENGGYLVGDHITIGFSPFLVVFTRQLTLHILDGLIQHHGQESILRSFQI